MAETILITGAAKGIGKAIAIELAENGYNIVINYHTSQKEAEDLEKEIRDTYHVDAMSIQADVSKEDEVEAMFAKIEKRFSGVYGLVNNAAVDLSNLVGLKNADEFRRTLDVNVVGAYNCAKRAAKYMLQKEKG